MSSQPPGSEPSADRGQAVGEPPAPPAEQPTEEQFIAAAAISGPAQAAPGDDEQPINAGVEQQPPPPAEEEKQQLVDPSATAQLPAPPPPSSAPPPVSAPPPPPAAPPPVSAPPPPPSAPPAAVAGRPSIPPPPSDKLSSAIGDKPPRRPRLWLRFFVAAVLIISSAAVATSVSILDYLGGIASALAHNGRLSAVEKFLARGYSGGPQTVLLIGTDHRPNNSTSKNGLSDTVILVRLDPSLSTINMLSIPRDLRVEIPGYGVGKFNSAYADGGPELSLRTLKQLTGVAVNHIFVVDFEGFAKAVDAIGCVYVDVDRRYYHSNIGEPLSEQYSEINIQPGYQLLCGNKALEFVRYRHTDTDLVREARQQQFLRDARQMVPTSQLIDQRTQLIEIFTKYTTSDLHSTEQLLEMLKLFVGLRNASIKQISFPAELQPVVENQPNYVIATPAAIHRTVHQFLHGEPASSTTSSSPHHASYHHRHRAAPRPQAVNLNEASELGAQEAAGVARRFRAPVFYPTMLPPGATFAEQPRTYGIQDQSGKRHMAYTMVVELQTGAYTAYFGLQGISGWSEPPILSGPSEPLTIGGRHFQVFTNGGHIRLIAWHQGNNVYWVYNTLVQFLTNSQMLGVARSLAELKPHR